MRKITEFLFDYCLTLLHTAPQTQGYFSSQSHSNVSGRKLVSSVPANRVSLLVLSECQRSPPTFLREEHVLLMSNTSNRFNAFFVLLPVYPIVII